MQKIDEFEWIISGAGPAGLACAIALIYSGVSVDQIFIAEMRRLNTKKMGKGKTKNYGSRERLIHLDRNTFEILSNWSVKIRGSPIKQISLAISKSNKNKNSIQQKDGKKKKYIDRALNQMMASFFHVDVGSDFGHQSLFATTHLRFQSVIKIGDLERALLNRFLDLGGKVRFGIQTELKGNRSHVSAKIKNKYGITKFVKAKFAICAEGKNSLSGRSNNNKMKAVSGDLKNHYQGYRFDYIDTKKKKPSFNLYFQNDMNPLGFTLNDEKGGTLFVFEQPQKTDIIESEGEPKFGTKTDFKLSNLVDMAQNSGRIKIKTNSFYRFSAQLFESVHTIKNNIIYVGDSARLVDPISGLGANLAIRDAWSIAEFFLKRKSRSANGKKNKGPMNHLKILGLEIRKNSIWGIKSSLFFHRLIHFGKKHALRSKFLFGSMSYISQFSFLKRIHLPKQEGKYRSFQLIENFFDILRRVFDVPKPPKI